MEIPQNRWFISWKNLIKIDDAKGVPHFRKPPYVHHLNHLGVFFHIACTSLQAKGREKKVKDAWAGIFEEETRLAIWVNLGWVVYPLEN